MISFCRIFKNCLDLHHQELPANKAEVYSDHHHNNSNKIQNEYVKFREINEK